MNLRPAVFLDRDGVLVVPEFRDGRSFAPDSLEKFAIYPAAGAALERLKDAGYLLVVVTNQPDVGHGKVLQAIVEKMNRLLGESLPVDLIKVCFHRQDENCLCRKPSPGLLYEAAEELRIDLAASWMIGDRASDAEAGRAAGCRTIYIDLEYSAELPPKQVDFVTVGITEAVSLILDGRARGNG